MLWIQKYKIGGASFNLYNSNIKRDKYIGFNYKFLLKYLTKNPALPENKALWVLDSLKIASTQLNFAPLLG